MRRLLVTAGATRNPVDAIRYLSAGATGTTGLAVARALASRFHAHLLGSEEACLRAALAAPDLTTERYGSTRDLMARMETHLRAAPNAVLVHSAAVGDYECNAVATKLPSGQPELVLRLTPGPKIVDHVRTWAPEAFLVSFKAGSPDWADDELEAIAQRQLARTQSDLVFANRIGALETTSMMVYPTRTERFTTRAAALAALTAELSLRA